MYVLRCIQAREDACAELVGCLADAPDDELVGALAAARDTSVRAVEAVASWRGSLWRAEPFVWRGRNYLLKMQTDLAFLGNPEHAQRLESVDLNVESDLELLVFLPHTAGVKAAVPACAHTNPFWAEKSAEAVDQLRARVHCAALTIADEGLVQAALRVRWEPRVATTPTALRPAPPPTMIIPTSPDSRLHCRCCVGVWEGRTF